jgi:hypothetical protein
MQSFAGAETTRRFSSILNSTRPMTGRPPKYAARKAVEFTMAGCPVLLAVATAALGVTIAPPAIADAGCGSVSASRFFFDLTQ